MNASSAYHRHMKRRVAQLGRPLPYNCEITMFRLSIISKRAPDHIYLQKELNFNSKEGVQDFIKLLNRLGYTPQQVIAMAQDIGDSVKLDKMEQQ